MKRPAIPAKRAPQPAVTLVTLCDDCHGVRRLGASRRLGSGADGRTAMARGPLTILVLLVAVGMLASACSSDDSDEIVVPDTTSTTRDPRPTTTTTSPDTTAATGEQPELQQEIVDRYEAFWDARFRAHQAPVNPDAPGLAEHATGPQLENVRAETQQRLDDGLALRPADQPLTDHRVRVVSVTADRAELQDCFVNDGVVYRVKTGEVVDDAVVTRNVSASMAIVDGVWKLERATVIQAGWNAYNELRHLLASLGVPAEQVRFIHEAATDEAKAKLFAACRDGRVAVLVGSTEKMGVGTNVQARAAALHHLDCPWRPADIEQRDGRVLRQGNQNSEVHVLRYVTEGSFDTYMWQTLERKATFIAQVTGGDVGGREVDDIGDTALSYAEVKALATGNPLIMEKAAVDAEVARLTRLQRAHADEQHRLRKALEAEHRHEASLRHKATRIELAISQRVDARGDQFRMTVGGRTFDKRVDAGADITAAATKLLEATPLGQTRTSIAGQLGGFEVEVEATRVIAPEILLRFAGGLVETRWPAADWADAEPSRIITALERRIARLDDDLASAVAGAERAATEAARAKARLGQPFEHTAALAQSQRRQREVNEVLVPDLAVAPPGLVREPPVPS
ncbi:MAG: helicase-related protein, partial [Acidimicrobiales bacterium]